MIVGNVSQRRNSFFDSFSFSSSFRSLFFSLNFKNFSHISILNSSCGDPVPILNGRALHSRYDPRKEASRRFFHLLDHSANHFVVLSFDFLYGVEYWVKKKITQHGNRVEAKYHLLLAVDDLALFDAFILHRHWDFLCFFASVKFVYLCDKNWPEILQFSLQNWLVKSFRGVAFFEKTDNHLEQRELLSQQFKQQILLLISNYFSHHFTRYIFEKKWLINSFINLIQQKNIFLIDSFLSKIKIGKEDFAIVVASGPSLDEQIDELKLLRQKKKVTIIAVDSAVPVLSECKIDPDIVVAVDAGYYNALDFSFYLHQKKEKSSLPKTILFTSLFVHPLLLRYAKNRNYSDPYFFYLQDQDILCKNFFSSDNENIFQKGGIAHHPSYVSKSSSVSLVAIDIVRRMGFKNTVAYGLDTSYPFLHGHASGSMQDHYYTYRSCRLMPREQAEFFSVAKQMEKIVTTKREGDDTFPYLYDTPSLRIFREELLQYFSRQENKSMKFFIRSPYFFAAAKQSQMFTSLKDVLLPVDDFQQIVDWVQASRSLSLPQKNENSLLDNSSFFRRKCSHFLQLISIFQENLQKYRLADANDKQKMAEVLDDFLKKDLPFLLSSIKHHQQIILMGKNILSSENISQKDLLYHDAWRLLLRIKRYFSSMAR